MMAGFIRRAILRLKVNDADIIQTVHDECAVNSATISNLKSCDILSNAIDSPCWPHIISGFGKKLICPKVCKKNNKKFSKR